MFSVPTSTAMSAGEPSPVGAPIDGGTAFPSESVGFDKMIDPGSGNKVRRAAKRAMSKQAAVVGRIRPPKLAPVKAAPVKPPPARTVTVTNPNPATTTPPASPKPSAEGGLNLVPKDTSQTLKILPQPDASKSPPSDRAKSFAKDTAPPTSEKPPPTQTSPETGSPAPDAGTPPPKDLASEQQAMKDKMERMGHVQAGTHVDQTAYKEILPEHEGRFSRLANTMGGRIAIDVGSFMIPGLIAGAVAPESEFLQMASWPVGMMASSVIGQKFARGSQRAQAAYIAGKPPLSKAASFGPINRKPYRCS